MCWWKKFLRKLLRRLLKGAHVTTMVGAFTFQCHNPDGSLAWEEECVLNGDTTSGLNDMLGVYFNSGTQKTTWYIALVDNSGFTAFAASDTISSHSGWSESTAYSDTTRRQWTPNAPSAGIITGSTASFAINGTATIHGAFIVSNSTKGGTTGQLFATGPFGSNQAVSNGQTLSVTYSKTLTPQ